MATTTGRRTPWLEFLLSSVRRQPIWGRLKLRGRSNRSACSGVFLVSFGTIGCMPLSCSHKDSRWRRRIERHPEEYKRTCRISGVPKGPQNHNPSKPVKTHNSPFLPLPLKNPYLTRYPPLKIALDPPKQPHLVFKPVCSPSRTANLSVLGVFEP